MSKLVDKERLAKLAKALDDRAKGYANAEKDRAMEVEAGLQSAINAINHAETGILKVAKDYVDAEIAKVDAAQIGQEISNLQTEDAEIRKDFAAADNALKAELQGEIENEVKAVQDALDDEKDVNVEGSLAAKVKAAQDDIDNFQSEQATKEQEQDAAIAAKVAQADYNAKMNELDQEDADLAKAIQDEATARDNADKALAERVAANEAFVEAHDHSAMENRIKALEDANKEGGEIKEAIDDVVEDLSNFMNAQADKEQEQDNAIAAKVAIADYNAKVGELESKNNTQDTAIANKVEQSVYNAKVEELAGEDAKIRGEFAAADNALDARLDVIEGAGEGSVAKALQDAKDYADQKIKDLDAGALELRVKANEDKLAGLENATVKAEIEAAQSAAEKYADDAITALVDSAPDAMNTLNELAKAINDNKGVYDAYVEEHATAMAQQKADLQKEIDDDIAAARTLISAEIDADVKEEADRAKGEEAAIRGEFANADATNLAAAKKYADDQDAALKAALQAEIDADVLVETNRAKGVEAELLAAINAKVAQADYNAKVAEIEGRIDDVEAFVEGHSHEAIEKDIDDLQADVQALESFMNSHSHATMEQGIADNKAAIEQEVKDRDAAIAEALEAYSDTEAVKAMLGNVVNSLALSMEDNKMMLKLGGVDGITIHETSLDMATDADIDAIIDGLDA